MEYQELRKALSGKGEAEEDVTGDHVFFYIEVEGKKARATKISHGAKGQIDDQLLSVIAKQMRLKTKELREFVECSLRREEWIQLWSERPGLWSR